MAVIEIAKIQVRRGQELQTGQPLTLDSGEFGWAIDTQKLYIGNGAVSEGAPAVGITEVITEHSLSNIFDVAGTYSYKGNTSSSPVKTGPSRTDSSLHRTVQKKLDDVVSIADFGVTPHLTNTETIDGDPVYKQIQQAIDEIFLNSDKNNPESRRKLLFPAGNYVITGTIYVPPYANLIGDGQDKTVLELTANATSLMQFADGTSVRGGPYVTTGSITSGGHPTGIFIEGLTFKYSSGVTKSTALPLLIVDGADNCQVAKCKFTGSHNPDLTSGANYTGIDIRSEGAIVSNNILIKDTIFSDIRSGINSNYNIDTITITNNKFNNLYRGIVFSENLALNNNTGPIRSTITENSFKSIEAEGVFVGVNNTLVPANHVAAYNTFVEVGNNLAGDGTGTNYIINFQSAGNVAFENRFERETFILQNGNDASKVPPSVLGKTHVYSNKTFSTNIQDDIYNVTPTTLVRIPYSNSDQKIKLQYIANKNTVGFSRKGELTISVSKLALGTTASVTESYTYIDQSGTYGDGGLSFLAEISTVTNQVKVLYSSDDGIGTLDYQYSYLQQ
jgi:hypothetical protein